MVTRFFLSTVTFLVFFLAACGSDYDDISTANGRRALLDQANNYLTAGQCVSAIETLQPLYNSVYVDDEIRLTYASAYACVAGFNFPSLITGLTGITSGDIWSPVIKSNYSATSADQHVLYLQQAATILRGMSTVSGSYNASDRPSDANLYMIFIQVEIIAKTIMVDTMGAADSSTGNKTVDITGLGSTQDQCNIQVAIATISDCLTQVSTGSAVTSVFDTISDACGGACPTNRNPSTCTATEQAQGALLISAIDSQWQ